MDIKGIKDLTQTYSNTRRVLAEEVKELENKINELKAGYLPKITLLADEASNARQALIDAIEDGRGLFKKPKTQTFFGVKVGLQKGKGRLEYADKQQVINLIKKYFPDMAEVLIVTKEEPAKDSLMKMDGGALSKLGVSVVGVSDEVIVKSTDTEIDKFVEKLLAKDKKEVQDSA